MAVSQCIVRESPNPGHIWPQVQHDFNKEFWNMIAKLPYLERNWSPTSRIWIIHPRFLSKVIWEAQHTFDRVFLVSPDNRGMELITYPRSEVAVAMDQPVEPPLPPPSVEQPGLF